jgi:hypothetical protein
MEGMRAKYIWSENAEKTTTDVMMLLLFVHCSHTTTTTFLYLITAIYITTLTLWCVIDDTTEF